ncbi:MAG: TonB-dependent receptor [Candidatus Latescibacterota bacterium]
MKVVVVVCLVALLAGRGMAAESAGLQGRVTDAQGAAVAQANVVVAGGAGVTRGAVTDAQGGYRLEDLVPGEYEVRVTHVSYKPAARPHVQLPAGQTGQLDFVLEAQVIFLEQQVISASRRQEKALEAPASVSVVDALEVQGNPSLSIVEQVKDLPAVDFAQYGLVQNSAVVRGFNNIFSGALLSLTDNRIARVPSLNVNSYNFIPVTNEDVERIEVVLGPGAALYGPNSANGVMHIITRSPLRSAGTQVSLGGGERDLGLASLRHAGRVTERLGYKLSAQYYQGTDWRYYDPEESAPARSDTERGYGLLLGADSLYSRRDFDIDRSAAEGRLDYQLADDGLAVVSAGYNNGSFIELTGLGAAQARDWTYRYVQTRLSYGSWFAQGYRNWSDAGSTFLLRSGEEIVDQSSLTVFQVQHSTGLGQRQRFTYGFDALLTRPDTRGTITGQNEGDDDINELGGYLQSESRLGDRLDLVLALRYDEHNRIEDPEMSPRAALVYKPRADQTWRLTYNRAFSTPTTNNLYLDLVSKPDAFGLEPRVQPTFDAMGLGDFQPIDVRAQGTYRKGFDEGFTFRRGADRRPLYRSPFTPMIAGQSMLLGLTPGSAGYPIGADGFLALDNPVATGVMWNVGRGATLQGFSQQAAAAVAQQMVAAGTAPAAAQAAAQQQVQPLAQALGLVVPAQLAGLRNTLMRLDLEKATAGEANPFVAAQSAVDVPRTRPTTTQTFELGYKGVLAGRLVVAADLYRTRTEDFVGPLAVETPNVFLDPASLQAGLGPAVAAGLQASPEAAAALQILDSAALGGNGNGSPVDDIVRLFAAGAARIPFGTVSPEQAYDPTAVIITYRNFGEVTVNGVDLSLAYYPNDEVSLTGNYSFVDDNFFRNLDGIADVALNAPRHKVKAGAAYRFTDLGLELGARVRYNDSFRMQSGVYHGEVDSYQVLDLNAAYRPPVDLGADVVLRLDVSNVLGDEHGEFIGGPEIGRLAFAQVGVSF